MHTFFKFYRQNTHPDLGCQTLPKVPVAKVFARRWHVRPSSSSFKPNFWGLRLKHQRLPKSMTFVLESERNHQEIIALDFCP